MPPVRFCSACGAGLATVPPVVCARCGTGHWLNPKPCANAIVEEAGRVLLTQRAHGPWNGLWCSPGGFCELGEHPLETVAREVLEETGYAVEVTGYLGTWVDTYADDPLEQDAAVINVGYYTAVPVGSERGAVDPAEVSEVAWFGWDELPDELAPPATLGAVLAAARAGATSPESDRPAQS